jgi:hypothetical protein
MQKFRYTLTDNNELLDSSGKVIATAVHHDAAFALENAPVALAALKVIALDARISAWLVENDPQAMKQVLNAIPLGAVDNGPQATAFGAVVKALRFRLG